jgi:hypothetical protein
MVAELAVIVVTGFHKLQGSLQQAPLRLAFACATPDCMGMALEYRPHLIGILVLQGVHGTLQASTLLEGEGVSLTKVGERFTQGGKVEVALDSCGTLYIGRLDMTVITQPLTQVFYQGLGCLALVPFNVNQSPCQIYAAF